MGLVQPNTGVDYGDSSQIFDSPGDAAAAASLLLKKLRKTGSLSTAPADIAGTNVVNPADPTQKPDFSSEVPQVGFAPGKLNVDEGYQSDLPKLSTPSFQASTTDQYGNVIPHPHNLTKVGKLVQVLRSAAQGGLDAIASGALDAVPGRSAFGAGVEGAINMPILRAQRAQALRQGAAQAALTEAENQPVETEYGTLPAGLVPKFLSPYLGYQGKIQAAQIGAGAKEQSAQTEATGRVQAAEAAKRFIPVPNVGLFDSATKSVIPGSQQGITVTPEIAQDYQLPNEFVGKPMSLQNLAALQRSVAFQEIPVQGAAGPALVNRKSGVVRPLGIGSPGVAVALARPVPVAADPNNPGNVTYQSAGQAIAAGSQSPQSAPAQTAKATARAIAPGGKVGEELNAYSTAIQHADLLSQAVKALRNGNIQTLNSLKNRFKNEFGYAGPITADAIANAYTQEITKMLSSNHITDSEIGQNRRTLNPSVQSPDQMLGVIDAYRALANSKMNVRQKGVEKGLKGQANFGDQNQAQGNTKYVPKGAVRIQ